ncbi:MAG: hypothetical protein MK214_15690 [Thalassotalea sp.]|nr:hypothetical protein [Thalassotalea sp.]
MAKLKKWYVIGKREFPTQLFYGDDYQLHDVNTVKWKPSDTSFGSYNGNYTPFPEIENAEQAVNALSSFGIPSFDTRDLAKCWAKKLRHGTWKYLKITDS